MNKNLVVTIKGLVEINIQTDPDIPHLVLEETLHVIHQINDSFSLNEIHIQSDKITLADLSWKRAEEPSEEEIKEWRKNWGQSHGEICSCLGFDPEDDNSTELIMLTGNYFFLIAEDDSDNQWFNKSSCSMMSEEEKKTADWIEENCI